MRGRTAVPYAAVTIKTDAGQGAADAARRAPERIPRRRAATGVDPRIPLRGDGRAGARLRRAALRSGVKAGGLPGVQPGTVVGQEGLEYYYDRYLRGDDGEQRVEVNAAGYPVPSRLPQRPPRAGHSLES